MNKSIKVNYKYLAASGTLLMALGSMLACLSIGDMSKVGDALLLIGIGISTWGFTSWRP